MLKVKNAAVVVVFISLKHNGLCGKLDDSNYFYIEESILCMCNTTCMHVMCSRDCMQFVKAR